MREDFSEGVVQEHLTSKASRISVANRKTRVLSVLICLTAVTLQTASFSSVLAATDEAGNYSDERVSIDRTSTEYKTLNAIGVVTPSDMRSHGTGFLSDLCHVLTNRHVVFHNIEDAVIGAKVTFSVGQTGTNRPPFQYMVLSGKVIGYGSSYTGYDSTANADWAVIKLESSIGSHVGFIPIYQMSTRRLAGRKIITAGYPGAKTRNGDDLSKLYGDLNCEIIGTNPLNGFLYHNCQATYGQSGSPLMAKGDDGIYYALGMPEHRTDITKSEDPNIANVGVSFSSGKDIYISEGDKIVAILKNDRCD